MKSKAISYETAQLLAGTKIDHWYTENRGAYCTEDYNYSRGIAGGKQRYIKLSEGEIYNSDVIPASTRIYAITQPVVQKWLRESHDIDVLPVRKLKHHPGDYYRYRGYAVEVTYTLTKGITYPEKEAMHLIYYGDAYESYEEALEEGIQQAVKFLINQGKLKGD